MKKKGSYKEYRAKYDRRVKAIYAFALIWLLISATTVYFLAAKPLWAASFVAFCGLLYIILIYMVQKNDNRFFANIIEDLSEMLDCLKELSGKEIFPSDEDSVLSKLQSQVLSLVHILKKQSEVENKEHENIKALVSDLSHQLKTPIATLKMYTDFLKQEDIKEEERAEYVDILAASVERLLFLSEGMIKLSRLESGLIHIEMKQQSINDTVLVAIKDAYVKARNKGIEVNYNGEFKGNVNHDRQWTAEAVFNLIDNAIKYGEAGSRIEVTVRLLGSSVEISVEDENTLINPKEYNFIFKRFYRGGNSKNIEGAGIGLYLTSDIIEKQGGFVSLKKGKNGNRFSIIFLN